MCNHIFLNTLIRGHIRVYDLTLLSLLINVIRFIHGIWRFTHFDPSPPNNPVHQNTVPPMKSTRTQLHVTDICESDDTLHAAALTAERTTPMLLPEAKIDDDDNIDDDLGGQ